MATGVMLGSSPSASAHFILRDTTTGMKTLFHVTPDHEPIAGKQSVISYEFNKQEYQAKEFTYILTVKSTRGTDTVPTEVTSNVVLADYVFAARGLYTISLTVMPIGSDKPASTFAYSQRVQRGQAEKQTKFPLYAVSAIVGALAVAGAAAIVSANSKRNERGR